MKKLIVFTAALALGLVPARAQQPCPSFYDQIRYGSARAEAAIANQKAQAELLKEQAANLRAERGRMEAETARVKAARAAAEHAPQAQDQAALEEQNRL